MQFITCSIICISCESHEQKTDEAFKYYKSEKILEIDSSNIFKDSINTLLKLINTKIIIKREVFSKFKIDLEENVKVNNLTLTHLKERQLSSSKMFRKIIRLEEINNQFITQLKDYDLADKNNRKDFEDNINKKLNDLNLTIKGYEQLK